MEASIRAVVELELLDRGLDYLECCDRCRRTLIVGEPAHVYDRERVVCDACRSFELDPPQSVRRVHGPAFGNTIRIIDQRRGAAT